MNKKRLQFLIPQYKETEDTIKYLLDSIEHQVGINFNDIGAIIVSDGGEYILKNSFLNGYSFDIRYVVARHGGVSVARNTALMLSDADYVMFCDADDCFCNIYGLKIILEIINKIESKGEDLDLISSKFFNEGPTNSEGGWGMRIVDHNNIYIHGIIYRRYFLMSHNIYFDERVWANEDCFFNIFAGFKAKNVHKLDVPVYCWMENLKSVTHDPEYLFKTLHQLIISNSDVVEVMIQNGNDKKSIGATVFDIICKIYLDLNKPGWYTPEHKQYLDITVRTMKSYLISFSKYCSVLTDDEKKTYLQRARGTVHYGNIESFTFNDFIKKVMAYGEEKK